MKVRNCGGVSHPLASHLPSSPCHYSSSMVSTIRIAFTCNSQNLFSTLRLTSPLSDIPLLPFLDNCSPSFTSPFYARRSTCGRKSVREGMISSYLCSWKSFSRVWSPLGRGLSRLEQCQEISDEDEDSFLGERMVRMGGEQGVWEGLREWLRYGVWGLVDGVLGKE